MTGRQVLRLNRTGSSCADEPVDRTAFSPPRFETGSSLREVKMTTATLETETALWGDGRWITVLVVDASGALVAVPIDPMDWWALGGLD